MKRKDQPTLRQLMNTFCHKPQRPQEIDMLFNELKETLTIENKKKLIQILDSKDEYTEQLALTAFVAGYNLANNINTELF